MFILCMDIGKTKTLAVILNERGDVLGKFISGPSGMWLKEETVIRNIREAIDGCLSASRLSLKDISLISISWADLDTPRDWENAWKVIEKIGVERDKVLIEHDAVAAYYAVTFGEAGVAVIAGTGSIGFGINSRGERMRSSGWGWLIGDEGSAYWIAVKALNAISRAYDGRGEKTILSKMISDYFGVENELEILNKVYKDLGCDPTEVSKIARIVDEAASRGDKVAKNILEDAGRELALAALCIIRGLKMEDEKIIVGGLGGVFRSKIVKDTFIRTVKEGAPKAIVKEPLVEEEPILGPIIMAFRKIGLKFSEEDLKSILKSMRMFK
ncbi:MAG: BadF/BadG/BcrA/BcrD ATPase family protein [Candidatus Bathyarchaeia archaeon]